MTPLSATKIELVVEAIEAMTLAQVVATSPACNDHERHIAVKNIAAARAVLAKALGEFLQPSLRLVETRDVRKAGEIERTITKTEITGAREIIDYGDGDLPNLA